MLNFHGDIIDIQKAIQQGNMVFICGTGVSLSVKKSSSDSPLSWDALLRHGAQFAANRTGRCASHFYNFHSDNDASEMIEAAERITKTLQQLDQFNMWINNAFSNLDNAIDYNNPLLSVLKHFWDIGNIIATTNYDDILCKALNTHYFCLPTDPIGTKDLLAKKKKGILHLHGHYLEPESVVFGLESYNKITRDTMVQSFMDIIAMPYTLLFLGVGEGLNDPNFSDFISRVSSTYKGSSQNWYIFSRDSDVDILKKRYSEQHCSVLNYGPYFTDLPLFLKRNFIAESKPGSGFTKKSEPCDDTQEKLNSLRDKLKNCNFDEEILKCFCKIAEQGYVPAQIELGDIYKDIIRDDLRAVYWYNMVRENENASVMIKALTQYKMGFMYEHGKGVALSKIKSFELYKSAAEKENADAQNRLAEMYRDGIGTLQNYQEALELFHRAAKQEHIRAQYNLGNMYQNGYGTPCDYNEAFTWYSKAASKGDVDSLYSLGLIHEYSEINQQKENQAFECYLVAAEKGHSGAQNRLALMYEQGKGTIARNIEESIKWYSKAAKNGNPDGQYNLGRIYYSGIGVSRNFKDAAYWYYKAAEQGHAHSQYCLGFMYENGQGMIKNYGESFKWYNKAIKQETIMRPDILGYMYENGKGTVVNCAKALEWYIKAVEQGYPVQKNIDRVRQKLR